MRVPARELEPGTVIVYDPFFGSDNELVVAVYDCSWNGCTVMWLRFNGGKAFVSHEFYFNAENIWCDAVINPERRTQCTP